MDQRNITACLKLAQTLTGINITWLALTAVLSAVSFPATAAHEESSAGRIYPVTAKINGNTYGEWSAFWHRWFLSIPANKNPVAGGDCNTGELGSVWFLAGIPSINGTNIVNCSVPADKLIFFPVINVECSNLEDPPFFGASKAARRDCARNFLDGAADLSVNVDGTPIPGIKGRFRATSPNFTFAIPPGNVLGVDVTKKGGFGESVADGYYLMLSPLSSGRHIIRVIGSFPDFDFTIDTTFVLDVR